MFKKSLLFINNFINKVKVFFSKKCIEINYDKEYVENYINTEALKVVSLNRSPESLIYKKLIYANFNSYKLLHKFKIFEENERLVFYVGNTKLNNFSNIWRVENQNIYKTLFETNVIGLLVIETIYINRLTYYQF